MAQIQSNQPADAATNLQPDPAAAASDVSVPQGPGAPALPAPSQRSRSLQLPQFVSLMLGNRMAVIGLSVLLLMVLMALCAPLLTSYDPNAFADLPGQPPSSTHWFGTNQQGQDIFAQVVYGARISLFVGATAALLATLISAAVGMIAAYAGGWVDEAISLVVNIFLVIPTFPLLIVIASYIPAKGITPMILIIAFTIWAGEARVLRSQALSLRSRDFVLAAATAGESIWRIVFGEIMPNMTSRIAAGFFGAFVGAIGLEAGLEFLGFGNPQNTSWGMTLFWAQTNSALIQGVWWHFTFAGMAIAITATALIFVNYAIDEISNPRLRKVKMPKPEKIAREEQSRTAAAAPTTGA